MKRRRGSGPARGRRGRGPVRPRRAAPAVRACRSASDGRDPAGPAARRPARRTAGRPRAARRPAPRPARGGAATSGGCRGPRRGVEPSPDEGRQPGQLGGADPPGVPGGHEQVVAVGDRLPQRHREQQVAGVGVRRRPRGPPRRGRRARPCARRARCPAPRGSAARPAGTRAWPSRPGATGAVALSIAEITAPARTPAAGVPVPCPGTRRARCCSSGSTRRRRASPRAAVDERTKSTCFWFTPSPYGSAVKPVPGRVGEGSWEASPASTVSSPVMPSTAPSWNSTRQPVWVSAPTASTSVKVRSLSMLVDPLGRRPSCRRGPRCRVIGAPVSVFSPARTSTSGPSGSTRWRRRSPSSGRR